MRNNFVPDISDEKVAEVHSLRVICRDILRGVEWIITLCDGWKGKRYLLTFVLHLMKLLSRMGLQDFCYPVTTISLQTNMLNLDIFKSLYTLATHSMPFYQLKI